MTCACGHPIEDHREPDAQGALSWFPCRGWIATDTGSFVDCGCRHWRRDCEQAR